MKKLRILIVTCVVMCSMFLAAGSAMAASTAWVITDTENDDGYANLTRRSVFSSGEGFAIYSYNDKNTAITLLNDTYFTAHLLYNDDDKTLKLTANSYDDDDNEVANYLGTLNLNSAGQFSFYYFNSDGEYYDISYALIEGSTSAYKLSISNMSQKIDLHDAAPVPIPASVVLFGTGLAGLLGLRRKRIKE